MSFIRFCPKTNTNVSNMAANTPRLPRLYRASLTFLNLTAQHSFRSKSEGRFSILMTETHRLVNLAAAQVFSAFIKRKTSTPILIKLKLYFPTNILKPVKSKQ